MVIVLLLLGCLAGVSTSSAAILEGVVLDREQGTPVPLAVVSAGRSQRAETDAGGRFRFEELLAGAVILRVEHVGYETWSREIQLGEGVARLVIRLEPRVETLSPVEVTTARPDASVPQGKRTIEPLEIRRGAGTVATDPLRAVQALPGAAAAGDDFSNRYVVRGGEPEESLVRIDGYTLLQPIHLEGFTSVVYDDLVGGIEVLPGALPPRYGDALSSITSLAILEPARTRGFFRYDLGSVAIGGQGRGGRSSALGALRGSFYNLVLRKPPGVDKRSFQDLSAKLTRETGPSRASLTLVASRDREEGDFDRDVDAVLLGVRLEDGSARRAWHADIAASLRDRTTTVHRPASRIVADLKRASTSASRVWQLMPRLQTRVDAEARYVWFEDGTKLRRSAGAALAAEGTWSSTAIALSFGGRVERIPFTETIPVSPYVSLRLRSLGRLVPGAGWRIVRQSPFHLHETPEVAGLPVDPGELLEAGAGAVVPLKAQHLSLSCEADLGGGFAAVLEIYEKRYRRLLTWGAEGPDAESIDDDGHGIGRGLEMTFRKEAGDHLRGWLSFSLSRTRKREGSSTELRPADHDRPRMLQGALEVPIRGGTTLSLAYRAATGRPITPLTGTGDGGMVPGLVNSERLPSYRRLDLKLEHDIEGKKNDAFLYLDLLNLTNRRNIVDVEQFVGSGGEVVRIYTQGVPILPVAGFGFYF